MPCIVFVVWKIMRYIYIYYKLLSGHSSINALYLLCSMDNNTVHIMVLEAKRKLALCEKVLNVISILTPGQVRMRGMFLSEMYGIVVYLGKRAFDDAEIGVEEYMLR